MSFFCIRFKLLGIVTTIILSSLQLQAQLEVQPGNIAPITPENLITNVFLGEGVEVTNVSYTGAARAVGYFQNATNEIGLQRGIVMSTGKATDAPGLNCPAGPCANTGNTGVANTSLGQPGDADLSISAGGQNTNDAAVYEIDFVPIDSTLQFRYVFASEEYQNYTCSDFNDVFGFYISGPGINGSFTNNAENIARVPGTNLPVAINTVNSGSPSSGYSPSGCLSLGHSNYFVDNTSAGLSIEYNGLTTVLTATVAVVPCQTYKIKLAIGDARDLAFDSAVFLEAKSFGSGSIDVESTTVSIDGTLAEGCSEAVLAFKVPGPVAVDTPLDYTIGGTAQNGIDYTFIPDNLFIPQGQDSIAIVIEAFEDNIEEGLETIIVTLKKNQCDTSVIKFQITDRVLEVPELRDTTICMGDSVSFDVTAANFVPAPISFQNTNAQVVTPLDVHSFPIEVSNVPYTEIGEGVINSICMNITTPLIYNVQVFLTTPGGKILELATQNGPGFVPNGGYINTCFTEGAATAINYNPSGGNTAPSSAVPFTGNWQPEGDWSDIYRDPVNGTWTLTVYSVSPGFAPNFQDWSITFNNTYFVKYNWDNAGTLSCNDCPNPIAIPTESTTYHVTATDAYGCSHVDSSRVEIITPLDAPQITCAEVTGSSVTATWNSVAGAASYQVTVDGGTAVNITDTTYQVTNLSSAQTVNLSVISVGSNECVNSQPSTVSCTSLECTLSTTLDSLHHISCNGEAMGAAFLSSTNATGTVTYALDANTSNNTGLFNNLAAGDYTVTITDDLCNLTQSFTINEPTAITLAFSSTLVGCNGGTNGTAEVTTSGGTTPYTYIWSNAATTASLTNLTSGSYSVTVTDANGCTATGSVVVNENSAMSSSMSTTDASCSGAVDGAATVTISGGGSNLSYAWNDPNNQTSATASNLGAGVYIVTVTDIDNNCSLFDTATIIVPNPILTTMSMTSSSCNGANDGTATVAVTGGVGTYTYQWSNSNTTASVNNLADGWHYVTITDGNNCFVSDSIQVTAPIALSISSTFNNISCYGGNGGTIAVTVSGGTGNYTYQWTNNLSNNSNQADLTAGTYTVTVTDENNCTITETVTLTEPDSLRVTLNPTMITCFGENTGNIISQVIGGTTPYTYAWNTSATSNNLSSLSMGTYTVTVTDANSCTATAEAMITQPPAITSTMTQQNVTCFGGTNGTATVIPEGGTIPYTYTWRNNVSQEATANDLSIGTYIVIITDANGCTTTNSANILGPSALDVSTSSTSVSCYGASNGTATATGTGGTGIYTYNWGAVGIGATVSNLAAGDYTVTITDGNQCTTTSTVSVPSPQGMTLQGTVSNVRCNNGSDGAINLTASEGTSPYTYLWSNNATTKDVSGLSEGTYTVTVTDANSCSQTASFTLSSPNELVLSLVSQNISCHNGTNGFVDATVTGGTAPYATVWSNGALSEDIYNVPAGTYTVTVTDANYCSATATVSLSQPSSPLVLNMSENERVCSGGNTASLTINVAGGTPGYAYRWNVNKNTATISGLGAGNYVVTVTDANGCTATASSAIPSLAEIKARISATPPSCHEGENENNATATITAVDGGVGTMLSDYQFSWGTTPIQTSATANNLRGGDTYYVTITDSNGCTGISSVSIPTRQPLGVNLQGNSNASCVQSGNGSLAVSAIGGVAPYTYNWVGLGQTGSEVTDLALGTYQVVVVDSLGCTTSAYFTVGYPSNLNVELSANDVKCYGGNDGSVSASGSGGKAPYSFVWSSSEADTLSQLASLAIGTYTVTMTDARGCTASAQVSIEQPDSLVFSVTTKDVTCNGDVDGMIEVAATGGTAPYMYSYDGGNTFIRLSQQTNVSPNAYAIQVKDVNGCLSAIDTARIEEPEPVSVAIQPDTTEVTYTIGDSLILSTLVTNGVGNMSWEWSSDAGMNGLCDTCSQINIKEYANNNYYVTVTDSNGCTGTDQIRVLVGRNFNVYVPNGFTPNGDGANDVLMVHGSSGIEVKSFRVYDRWGEMVFQASDYNINSTDPAHVWDGFFRGTTMNPGVFVWHLEVEYVDGGRESFEGNVSLLR